MIPSEWIAKIQDWARHHDRIAAVYLFGSRAKGLHRPDSDVDLAVLIDGSDPDERDAYGICVAALWRAEIVGLLPLPIDFIFAHPETDTRVWPAVLDHGVKLYPPQDS